MSFRNLPRFTCPRQIIRIYLTGSLRSHVEVGRKEPILSELWSISSSIWNRKKVFKNSLRDIVPHLKNGIAYRIITMDLEQTHERFESFEKRALAIEERLKKNEDAINRFNEKCARLLEFNEETIRRLEMACTETERMSSTMERHSPLLDPDTKKP